MLVSLNSSDDLLAEIVLESRHDWEIRVNHPFLGECQICLDEIVGTYTLTTNCQHSFHRNCILKNVLDYKRDKCPTCDYEFKFKLP